VPWRQRIRLKWPYILMYSFYVVAGVLAFIYPTRAILDALQIYLAYLWSSFLFFGSALSLYGSLRDRISGEIVGLPLLATANAIFGTALLAYGVSPAAYAIGLIFWGVGFGLVGRWFEMKAILKIAREARDGKS